MNIAAYLKKLDGQITEHRQQIALHQLEIARIEDARRVIVGIEEKEAGHFGADFGLVDGVAVLIARRAGDEEGTASAALKYGSLPAPKKPASGQPLTLRILQVLAEASEPMTGGEIGVALPDVLRKRIHNCCSNLRGRGSLTWDAQHRYSITKAGRRELGLKGKVKRTPQRRSSLEPARASIEQVFSAGDPLSPGEVVAAVIGERANVPGQTSKQERDRVYAVVHQMKTAGKLVRLEDGRYQAA